MKIREPRYGSGCTAISEKKQLDLHIGTNSRIVNRPLNSPSQDKLQPRAGGDLAQPPHSISTLRSTPVAWVTTRICSWVSTRVSRHHVIEVIIRRMCHATLYTADGA